MYLYKELQKYEVERWVMSALNAGIISQDGIIHEGVVYTAKLIYPLSVRRIENNTLALIHMENGNALLVIGPNQFQFEGCRYKVGNGNLHFCGLTHSNAERLRSCLPFTSPSVLTGHGVTIGLGDRLGVASPGHIRAIRRYCAVPVLAQQSLRELELTNRDYFDAVDSATWAVFQEGYESPWGADGDHLKTESSVKKALSCGCTMITADLSEYILNEYASCDSAKVLEKYEQLDDQYKKDMEDKYLNLIIKLDTGDVISFTRMELARIVLVYKDAIEHACRLYSAGKSIKRDFNFEISIDETVTPTLPQAHIFVAMEAKDKGIDFSSLAPRFIGEFQKGIDYIGGREEFDSSFKTHAAIARYFGYCISVHSGSDKFTVFPSIGKHTKRSFHLKTSGTSWLQALKVLSEVEPDFYRKLHKYAYEVFPVASKYYHITPNISNLTDIDRLEDKQLSSVFLNPDDRQVLHVSYGEILREKILREKIFKVLGENIKSYWDSLEEHIGKHLESLGVKKA